jgi:Prp8 binding protein
MEGPSKRKYGDEAEQAKPVASTSTALIVKKQRTADEDAKGKQIIHKGPPRTSSLDAPIMLLEGHAAEVFTVKFDPTGRAIASGSYDKRIFLWGVQGECPNFMVLAGHKNAVVELHWSVDSNQIYSASADKTLGVWDAVMGRRVRKLAEHISFVNSCCPSIKGDQMLISGSDDGSAKLWDVRKKNSVQTYDHKFQVTAVAYSLNGEHIYTGSLDSKIRVWDIRKNAVVITLDSHLDTVTGLRLSPDGSYLLSNSMDNQLHSSDIRPYVSGDRCVKTFTGHMHGIDKNLLKCNWSADGSKVSAGSADRFVYVWDTVTRRILYKLPGHVGTVNEVDFHPREPIIASCSTDKRIYLGEIEA